jgi:hypothetical protein
MRPYKWTNFRVAKISKWMKMNVCFGWRTPCHIFDGISSGMDKMNLNEFDIFCDFVRPNHITLVKEIYTFLQTQYYYWFFPLAHLFIQQSHSIAASGRISQMTWETWTKCPKQGKIQMSCIWYSQMFECAQPVLQPNKFVQLPRSVIWNEVATLRNRCGFPKLFPVLNRQQQIHTGKWSTKRSTNTTIWLHKPWRFDVLPILWKNNQSNCQPAPLERIIHGVVLDLFSNTTLN